MPLNSPKLWIVATPIGNAGDLSPRAREILATADLVLAEDTRRAARLFHECGLEPRKLTSFFEHNEQARQDMALDALHAGSNVALISDAGTPIIADPGYRLIRACQMAGFEVSPVPGPSAPIAALSACGLPPLPFTFLGFLPRGNSARADLFASFQAIPGSIVFFERKDRLKASLEIAHRVLGNREFAICRELTKTHEEFIVGNLGEIGASADDLKGEITVVIGPPPTAFRTPASEVLRLLAVQRDKGAKLGVAAREIRRQCSGWSSSEIYALATANGDA